MLRQVVEDHPESGQAHVFLGNMLINQGKHKNGQQLLRKALKLNEDRWAWARNGLAYSLARQGKYAEARHECEETIRRSFNDTYALAIYGFVYKEEHKLDLAEEKLLQAVNQYAASSSPTVGPAARDNRAYRWALNQLGFVLEEKDGPERAVEFFWRAFQLNPEDQEAKDALGRLQKLGIEPKR